MIDLSAAGLTETEAKCYIALLERKAWKPAELAQYVSETRTNSYKILDKLVEYNLAERFDQAKKLHYRATNPTRLLERARELRAAREMAEKELELQTESLMQQYFTTNEQAGVRYFQGDAELKEIFLDQIKTGQPIYLIRPHINHDVYDFNYMSSVRHMARKAGIQRYAITPDQALAAKNYLESDPFMLLDRTWIAVDDYTAPVEWNIYGDKVSVMSYGNEAMGMIIESPQIAESFRQLYRLLERGLREHPDYQELPRHAKHIASTSD